jgi:hypothetical protein
MSAEESNFCQDRKTVLQIKAKRSRFKAGTELSGKMNLAQVEVTDSEQENQLVFELKIELEFKDCSDNY